MFSEEDLDPEMLAELIEESREHLANCEPVFLKVERSGAIDPEEIDEVFRNIHSIKGGFRLFGYTNIIDLTHAVESIFSAIREGSQEIEVNLIDYLIQAFDKISVMVKDPTHSADMSIAPELALLVPYLDEESKAELTTDVSQFSTTKVELIPSNGGTSTQVDESPLTEEVFIHHKFSPGKLELLKSDFTADIHDLEPFTKTGKHLFLVDGTTELTKTPEYLASMLVDNNVFEGYTPRLKDFSALIPVFKPFVGHEDHVILFNSVLEHDMVEFALDIEGKDFWEISLVDEISEAAPAVEEGGHFSQDELHVAQAEFEAEVETSAPTPAAPKVEVESPVVEAPQAIAQNQVVQEEITTNVEPAKAVVRPPKKSENKSNVDESIRVKVDLLNTLMNAAGELILNRNQLLQTFNQGKGKYFDLEELDTEIDRFGESMTTSLEAFMKDKNVKSAQYDEYLNGQYQILTRQAEDLFNKPLNSDSTLSTLTQSLDRNTSTLQESIMSTRMQPIMNLFNKFPRVIRDLTMSLQKEVELELKGRNVELDKTILEKLADPMVHLIRNSVDHGIEMPEVRQAAGKERKGLVELNAYHEGGKVIITIKDDGGGIKTDKILESAFNKGIITAEQRQNMTDTEVYSLIFAPGFSTADQVSDISGRGVGMDVVKTNIESLGGTIEVESAIGKGSTFTMRLPLTLAIIPSLIVGVHGLTFAVPQLALEEIVRVRAKDISSRIQRIHNAEVLRLREKILPLVRLSDLLNSRPMFKHPVTGEWKEDLRARWSDRRNDSKPIFASDEFSEKSEDSGVVDQDGHEVNAVPRSGSDRRTNLNNAIQIIVLKVGNDTFGMIVDKVFDNEEIVIKPLSRYLNKFKVYSGMAILGSGDVAMILDVNGLARIANLQFSQKESNLAQLAEIEEHKIKELQKFLLFKIHENEKFAITLDLVKRVQAIKVSDLQEVGGKLFLNTRDTSLEILRLDDTLPIKKSGLRPDDEALVIVPTLVKDPIGLLVTSVEDTVQISMNLEHKDFNTKGIVGTFLYDSELVMVIDIYEIFEKYKPESYEFKHEVDPFKGKKVLLAEDTQFFQRVITKFLLDQGFEVDVADDGEKAWDKLVSGKEYDILISDVQMPHLDGFGLVSRVRNNKKLANLPIMMLTSMASTSYQERGEKLGVNAYEIKLNKAKQIETLTRLLG